MNKTENLKVVTLQPSDSEYTTVVNLFNTTSQGNYTITKVNFTVHFSAFLCQLDSLTPQLLAL